ncbi:MAG: Zn-dependent hydrolase [Novibacillus thermophilus]
MRINIERLMSDIERYALYGADSQGGITRPSFSEDDYNVRERFVRDLREMGLSIVIDGAANIWGKRLGNGQKEGSIVIGSHLDTVTNGGKYDGALGVLAAMEIVRTLKEHDVVLQHDLEIVSFTAEEPNDYNISTLGSRSFVGRLTPDDLKGVTDSNGMRLEDSLERAGGGLHKFFGMADARKEKKAFVELHIEQGRRLAVRDISVAVVDRIVGIYRDKVTVTGEANHAGTTMMADRYDALTAAAEMVLAVEDVCCHTGDDTVGTVGKLNVIPNAANIVPGQVEFILEVRGETEKQIKQVLDVVGSRWETIQRRRKVSVTRNNILNQKPVPMDQHVVKILQQTADELSLPYVTLASMAGHDASHMAHVAKTAMIFVKSPNGKSHCPEEYSAPEDIEKAVNLMLRGIVNLDRDLA